MFGGMSLWSYLRHVDFRNAYGKQITLTRCKSLAAVSLQAHQWNIGCVDTYCRIMTNSSQVIEPDRNWDDAELAPTIP